ncbi:methyltransferase domain-containing protein [Candidatus Lucifugimonas marina]|uniref:Arsenite methyltransferase n=1 Tax=Candidatus Lucifugimonas marina TaxID=3038979 RepID=A0AAJ5ZBR5_9CHLR|nr:methyltransferase domain-containing protein [SAR202 cluster bacterium JH702]MDG0869787.1 methyltransferase domain-containing protein [SAR202 cluster bacterium JH639]WFG34513.1 methyltransferase domain-containing protein [SAR202 cluster bacterium JH545]WFG38442.1 methyltransferase domain-containing protein [SAR202 cluster bacterium JH1073]
MAEARKFVFVSPDYGSSITENGCCGSGCCDFEAVVLSGNAKDITNAVKQRYGALAERAGKRGLEASEDKSSDKFYSDSERALISDEVAGASTGVGNPVRFAEIKAGEIVLDLGSGGGIDCFIAASQVGSEGKVIGVDMTPRMASSARDNAKKLTTTNVTFKRGHIEQIPQDETSVDVVISNNAIALSEWKHLVFSEMFRVLKPGGRFVISERVVTEALPESVQDSTHEWVEGIAGASLKNKFIETIETAGFVDVEVVDEQPNNDGDEEWRSSLVTSTIRAFKPDR